MTKRELRAIVKQMRYELASTHCPFQTKELKDHIELLQSQCFQTDLRVGNFGEVRANSYPSNKSDTVTPKRNPSVCRHV